MYVVGFNKTPRIKNIIYPNPIAIPRTLKLDRSLVLSTTDLIVNIEGRKYWKKFEGWALAAYITTSNNYTGPILVSHIPEAVAYRQSYNGTIVYWANTTVYMGVTYYISQNNFFMGGNTLDLSELNRTKLNDGHATNLISAANELLDRYFRKGW